MWWDKVIVVDNTFFYNLDDRRFTSPPPFVGAQCLLFLKKWAVWFIEHEVVKGNIFDENVSIIAMVLPYYDKEASPRLKSTGFIQKQA